MKAAVLRAYGATPEFSEFDDPEPDGKNPILEILVAGVNPIDMLLASGKVRNREPSLPSVVGLEGVGEVDGTRYYFYSAVEPFGSMGERATVKREAMIELPGGLDDGLAVALGISGLAAWLALTVRAQLGVGESVLVLGAGGIVGQIAVQGARLLGAGKVIAAARDHDSLERAHHELGADAVVELDGDGDLTERLRAAGGGGYDVVIDPLWGEPGVAALAALNTGGRLIQIGNSAGLTTPVPIRELRNQLAKIIGHTNNLTPSQVKREAYTALAKHAAAGDIVVPVQERPLAEVAEPWQGKHLRRGHKQVLRVR